MNIRDDIIATVIAVEGGFSDRPDDSGGPTNYGITQSVALSYGYTGRMEDLPLHVAKEIYAVEYWEPVRGDQLAALSADVAREVFDTAVNTGRTRAGVFLQRSLNVLTEGELLVDGAIGPETLAALRRYLAARDEGTLVKALDCLQGAFYIGLAERRRKDRSHIYGWLRNRVGV